MLHQCVCVGGLPEECMAGDCLFLLLYLHCGIAHWHKDSTAACRISLNIPELKMCYNMQWHSKFHCNIWIVTAEVLLPLATLSQKSCQHHWQAQSWPAVCPSWNQLELTLSDMGEASGTLLQKPPLQILPFLLPNLPQNCSTVCLHCWQRSFRKRFPGSEQHTHEHKDQDQGKKPAALRSTGTAEEWQLCWDSGTCGIFVLQEWWADLYSK